MATGESKLMVMQDIIKKTEEVLADDRSYLASA